jgi:hypothetical protein
LGDAKPTQMPQTKATTKEMGAMATRGKGTPRRGTRGRQVRWERKLETIIRKDVKEHKVENQQIAKEDDRVETVGTLSKEEEEEEETKRTEENGTICTPAFASMKINSKEIEVIVDSGAGRTLLNATAYRAKKKPPKVKPCTERYRNMLG